jgi:hypothetical protein
MEAHPIHSLQFTTGSREQLALVARAHDAFRCPCEMKMPAQRPFPFFTGSQGSGTTLLRVHELPELAVPPESHFIPELAERRERCERPDSFDVDAFLADLQAHERFRR